MTPQSLEEGFSVPCAQGRSIGCIHVLQFPAPQTLSWMCIREPEQ